MRTELKKASLLSEIYQGKVRTWAVNAEIELNEQEFLVDYYIYPQGHLHCPILTAESESQEDGEFFDLSKLLLVNSPRRVYIANVQTGKLEDALLKITSMLNEALASGAIHNSDQIVFILYKKSVQTVTLRVYDYDQYRHV